MAAILGKLLGIVGDELESRSVGIENLAAAGGVFLAAAVVLSSGGVADADEGFVWILIPAWETLAALRWVGDHTAR